MDDRLEIYTLGGVRIMLGGQPVAGLTNRKAVALLIYLACTRRPHPRAVLAELLWDERSQSQALSNLRKVLMDLRQVLGARLVVSREAVSLDLGLPVWIDAIVFSDSLEVVQKAGKLSAGMAGQAAEAVGLYQGNFLAGFGVSGCLQFEEWQVSEQERLHRLAVDGLWELTNFAIEQQAYQYGLIHAARLLDIDPLMEDAHRQMMRLLAYCEQSSAALDQFETCQRLLRDELGIEPSDETRQLYEQIRAGKLKTKGGPGRFPQPGIEEEPLHNIPVQITSFIGRRQEIQTVRKLLSTSRLVTLIGSGGVGKSRLALEVGKDLLADYPNGVWLVELASLTDPQYVLPAIGSVFKLQEQPKRSWLQVLQDYLRKKTLLLLLDNCEHLITTCAQITESLLMNTTGVRILATSREWMNIAGEAVFNVPSLSLPEMTQNFSPEVLQQSDSACLFAERAAYILHNFEITPENALAISQICHRLDGIPLALELAAARLKILRVEQIAERLDDAFRLLTSCRRTALPHQQTLRATMDWSYNMLSEPERLLLRRLSVFAGGWELEAAEAICCDSEITQPLSTGNQETYILDLLSGLVSKSMVNIIREKGLDNRYRLLETIRQYALEKLLDSGEIGELRRRHLAYFTRLAEEADQKIRGGEQARWYGRLEANLENIRLALEWGMETDPSAALRLVSVLVLFWYGTNYLLEGIRWLEACIQNPANTARTIQRGRALIDLSMLSMISLENFQDQWNWAQEGLDICQELKDRLGQASAHLIIGRFNAFYRNFSEAKSHFDTSRELFWTVGDRWWQARILLAIADLAVSTGDISSAKTYLEQCLKISRELNDDRGTALTLIRQADILSEYEGNLREGRELCEQGLAILQRMKLYQTVVERSAELADIALWQGDFSLANETIRRMVAFYEQTGATYYALVTKGFIGRNLALQGLHRQAVELLEQTLDQLSTLLNKDLRFIRSFYLPTYAYALANMQQIDRAKAILDNLELSQMPTTYNQLMLLWMRGRLAFLEGNGLEAARQYRECLENAVNNKNQLWETLALEGLSGALYILGRQPEAVQSLATAYVFRKRNGAPVWPGDQPFHDRVLSGLRQQIGEDAFQEYWRTGESQSLDQAVALVRTT